DSLQKLFDNNLSLNKTVTSQSVAQKYPPSNLTDGSWDSFWISAESDTTAMLTIDLAQPQTFDHIVLQDFIPIGQRIASYSSEVKQQQGWQKIADGTTIGYKHILTVGPVTTSKLRLRISKSHGRPALANFALYNSQN